VLSRGETQVCAAGCSRERVNHARVVGDRGYGRIRGREKEMGGSRPSQRTLSREREGVESNRVGREGRRSAWKKD